MRRHPSIPLLFQRQPQLFPRAVQHGLDLALGKAELPGDVLYRRAVPVPGQKHLALGCGQVSKKTVQKPYQFMALHGRLRVAAAGDALAQLLQSQRRLTAAALQPPLIAQALKGQAAGQLAEEQPQHRRPVGRHGVPRRQPGIRQALLRVFVILQQAIGDMAAISAVFRVAFGNGLLRPLPVQRDNGAVLHGPHLPGSLLPFYLPFPAAGRMRALDLF